MKYENRIITNHDFTTKLFYIILIYLFIYLYIYLYIFIENYYHVIIDKKILLDRMTTLNIPADLPLSRVLFKQSKLWVWDFDDTLIDTSTYYSQNMKPEAILERTNAALDVEVPQWRYFRRLVEFLVEHGRYVAIASFGTYEIIQAYMKRIMGFNQQFFTKKNIIAPEYKQRDLRRFNQPPNKNEYIYQLMRIYRVQDFKRVVLFDDNSSNIADATGIGIIGVQVPSHNGGDKGNFGFGPWLMTEFDKNLKEKCGDELYRNRTYTGLVSKENYIADAYDNPINYGTGTRSKDNYFMEPYTLDNVNDSSVFLGKTAAFGTGIGDRKVNSRPQFAWNGYRMPRRITPQWWNGNWVNVPGMVTTPGYWEGDSLGGSTISYWDKHQEIMKEQQEKQKLEGKSVIYPSGGTVNGVIEQFESNTKNNNGTRYKWNNDIGISSCGCSVPPTWLMILLFIILVIIVIVMTRL